MWDGGYFYDGFVGEDQVEFAFGGDGGVAAVAGVFGAVLAVQRAERFGGLLAGFDGVGGADELAPFCDGTLGDEFQAEGVV